MRRDVNCQSSSRARMIRSQETLFSITGFIGLSHCCVKRRFGVMVYCVVFGCTTTMDMGGAYTSFRNVCGRDGRKSLQLRRFALPSIHSHSDATGIF